MKSAGKSLEYKIFNGVHGFANPSNPKYDEHLSQNILPRRIIRFESRSRRSVFEEVMGWYVIMKPTVVNEESKTAIGKMCIGVFGTG